MLEVYTFSFFLSFVKAFQYKICLSQEEVIRVEVEVGPKVQTVDPKAQQKVGAENQLQEVQLPWRGLKPEQLLPQLQPMQPMGTTCLKVGSALGELSEETQFMSF